MSEYRKENGKQQHSSVSQQSLIRQKGKKKRKRTADEFFNGILEGNRIILGQAITLIESSLEQDQQTGFDIIEKCLPHAGRSIRIGITGVPGAGKSTFIEAFGLALIKENRKIAVLAIDPTSELSRGSILGDKTRMLELSNSEKAFIRPSPSLGTLGGVTRKTRESIVLCEAAGFDTIFVETVGVGQSETMVHSMVDFFLLLLLAGAGDELQGIKRGIVEMADLLAITKADHHNVSRAEKAKKEYENALHLFPPASSGWIPKVITCSALENTGIKEIWDIIQDYYQLTKQNGFFDEERKNQDKSWIHKTIMDLIRNHFYHDESIKENLPEFENQVIQGERSPFAAARELYRLYMKK